MFKSVKFSVNIKGVSMARYLLISSLIILTSCSVHGVSKNPIIQYDTSKKVIVILADLYPDFKNKSEKRQLIEITISSDIELITLSLKNSTTLIARIGFCSDGKHIPELASNSVFLDGKTIEYYLINNNEPNTKDKSLFRYQLYLNYEALKDPRYKNTELCAEIIGSSYGNKFSSNKVRLDYIVE